MPVPTPNLVLYGDAGLTNYQDVGTGTTTPAASNNDPVGHIIDQSGSGNDLVAATSGARPSLQLGAAPSGLNAWQFSATGPNILQSRTFPSALSQPYTLFMVMKQGFYGGLDIAWCGKADNVYWYVNGQAEYPYWALNATTDAPGAQYVDASWHLFTFVVNGASTIVRMDGHIVYSGASFGSPGILGLDSLTIGGYSNLVSFPWSGQVGTVVLYNGDQTANFATIEGFLQARWGTPALATSHFVVFEGDSITHGPAGSVGTATGPPYLGYPNDAAPSLAPMAVVNSGQSGFRIVSYSDNPAASLTYKASTRENPFSSASVSHVTDDVLHLVPSGKQGVLHVLIGINDIAYMQTPAGISAGLTIATIFSNLKTYCNARRTAGWNKIVVGTLTSSNLGESQRESLNTLIRGDSSFYDALADYAADSRIGADGAYASTTYFLDGTHPTTTGQQIMAGIATAAIQSLFPVALAPSGIATAEVDGTPTIGLTITRTPAGIGSAEVDGTPTIGSSGSSITLSPSGIGTGEVDGTPAIGLSQSALGAVLSSLDILDDVKARLWATGAFDAVYRGASPEVRGRAASDRLAAIVAATSWEQTDLSDDETMVQSTRNVRWQLTLIVRDDDPETREKTLNSLLVTAQNTLDGQSLGGVTIPAWTRLKSGVYQPATPPEQRMVVTGEFAYWLEGFGGNTAYDD